MLHSLVKGLVVHGQIHTTLARAKEAQRLADRLITLGKEGSVHSRRRAFRVLQDRTLVKQLFADLAPRFSDVSGGYTRVLRASFRRGDGAQQAVLAFSRLPVAKPAGPTPTQKTAPAPQTPSAAKPPKKDGSEEAEKPKKFFEGLRKLWTRKKQGKGLFGHAPRLSL